MLRFQKGERRQAAPTVQNNKLLLCVELRVKVRSSSLPSQHVRRRALWRWLLWCRCRSGRGRDIHSRLQSREDLECVCAGARRATLLSAILRRTNKSRSLTVGLGHRRCRGSSRTSSHELSKLQGAGVTNQWRDWGRRRARTNFVLSLITAWRSSLQSSTPSESLSVAVPALRTCSISASTNIAKLVIVSAAGPVDEARLGTRMTHKKGACQ